MIQGLNKIKSIEEYELAQKELKYCIHEYRWISDAKDPKKEVEEQLKKCMKELRENMDRDEELNLLSKIHTLKTKYISIVRGEYKNDVKTNILGLILITEQYEAASQNVSFSDLISGLLKGTPETKNYLRKKYMFTLSNMYGIVPAPNSLNLEKMEDILDYIAKNYDLVDIDLSDRNQKDMDLVPVQEPVVGIKASTIQSINKTAEKIINEKTDRKETKAKESHEESHVQTGSNKGKSKSHDKEVEKGEIEK